MTTPVQPESQRPFGRWVRRGLALALAGVVAVPTGVALIALSGLENQYADLIAQFVAPAVFGALGLAVVLALFRRWRWIIAALVAAGLLLTAAWPQWRPAPVLPRDETATLRIYSANLWVENRDVEAIAASIRAADADIVILIELARDPALQVGEWLDGYPHRVVSTRLDQTRGPSRSLIASRFPLIPRADPPDGLHSVAATARTPMGPLNIVGVHLTRPWPFQHSWGQISQTLALQAVVEGLDGPVVVAGDFNSVSTARIGRQVRRDLGLHPAPGFPGTWPAAMPSFIGITIDQVYASPDLAFVSRRLGQSNGSDHRPVVTEITRAAD